MFFTIQTYAKKQNNCALELFLYQNAVVQFHVVETFIFEVPQHSPEWHLLDNNSQSDIYQNAIYQNWIYQNGICQNDIYQNDIYQNGIQQNDTQTTNLWIVTA